MNLKKCRKKGRALIRSIIMAKIQAFIFTVEPSEKSQTFLDRSTVKMRHYDPSKCR